LFQPAPTEEPQGTAEPFSHGWGTPAETSLRKGKILPGSEERSVRNCPVDTKAGEEGGAPGASVETLLQLVERPQWRRYFPEACREDPRWSRGKMWGGRSCRQ